MNYLSGKIAKMHLTPSEEWAIQSWWLFAIGTISIGFLTGLFGSAFSLSRPAASAVIVAFSLLIAIGFGLGFRRSLLATFLSFLACLALALTSWLGISLLWQTTGTPHAPISKEAILIAAIKGVGVVALIGLAISFKWIYKRIFRQRTLDKQLKNDVVSAGYLAFQNGEDLHANPYKNPNNEEEKQLSNYWVRGFNLAERRRNAFRKQLT